MGLRPAGGVFGALRTVRVPSWFWLLCFFPGLASGLWGFFSFSRRPSSFDLQSSIRDLRPLRLLSVVGPGFRATCMSDRSQPSDLDLESLAEAFAQLQVAAGALTRRTLVRTTSGSSCARRPLLPGLALHLPPPRRCRGLGPPLGLCLTFCLWCPPLLLASAEAALREPGLLAWRRGGRHSRDHNPQPHLRGAPTVCRSFGEFKTAVGRLLPGTVCHGWPTEGVAGASRSGGRSSP